LTNIILVRHAECEGNVLNALTGRTEYKLTSNGVEMAQELSKKMKNYKIDRIYSSVSTRCIETVRPISERLNLEVITSKELMEKDFGIYDGMTWEEVNKINPQILKNKKVFHQIIGIPKQETTDEVENRVNKYIKKISIENEGKTILICSHGCAIYSFLNHVNPIEDLSARDVYSQKNCSINVLSYEKNKFKILKINGNV